MTAGGLGGSHEVQRIELIGRGFDATFLDFAAERAKRFSLDGWATLHGGDGMTIVAAGPPALIDMLEVACMLGPIGALVDTIERRADTSGPLNPGFRIIA